MLMMNSAGEETTFLDGCLEEAGVTDTLQRAFSREKTKSFVSRNIGDNVEDLISYKKRAEMLEKEEISKRKEISTPKVLENNAREYGRVPPNSPNNDEFEFDCWDYFSSIFFQLFPDSGKRSVRPKSNGFYREDSLDMRKELEWRASRERLRESIRCEDSTGVYDDKVFSERHTSVKFEESPRNTSEVKKKQKAFKPSELSNLTKIDSKARRRRYNLVLPEKPRNPFLQKSVINRERRRKDTAMYKSMESTYEEIKNLEFKKASKLGAEQKQTLSFTDDNTCTVYFPESKQDRQTVPAATLGCKANLIPRTVQRENTELPGVIKTVEEGIRKGCVPGETFDSEVKKYLVTCSFRLSSKKGEKQKSDIPKDVQKTKSFYATNKLAKQNTKEVDDVGSKFKNGIEFSPKVLEKDTKTRNSLFAEEKDDKMNKYRKDNDEQNSLEKSQVLELKTRQFEFPVFQKGEVLCHQVKRVTFAPLPILTSKFTYEKKDYDTWSRTDKKTVKPIEIKWKV